MKNSLITSILLLFVLVACSQVKNDRIYIGKTNAEQELKSFLSSSPQHNVIDNKKAIIKDSLTAIDVAEPILFNIYGKENIVKERPYESHLIDDYWVINGTLPKDSVGGTFLIIIDSRNGTILKITHGK